jgi:hypothetical protein
VRERFSRSWAAVGRLAIYGVVVVVAVVSVGVATGAGGVP